MQQQHEQQTQAAGPSTPESPFARGGGVRLQSLAAAEQLRERETMNLKMEVANLRERLHLRVGGDTNAIELEDENFTLRRALQDAQKALMTQREAADERYSKTLFNLMRVDNAWKAGAEELARAQQAALDAQQRTAQLETELQTRSDDLERQVRVIREQLDESERRCRDADEQQSVQEREAAAAQLAAATATAQLQQLRERCAVVDAQLAASQQREQQVETEAAQLRDELARLETARGPCDERLQALETETERLQQQVAELQTQATAAKRAFEQREAALEARVQLADQDATRAHEQVTELKQLVRDVLALLAGATDSSDSSLSSLRELAGDDVRARVKRDVHRAKLVAIDAEKAKVRVEGLERQLARLAKAAHESSDVRAENERLKKKLAAARSDRLDVSRTPVKTSRTLKLQIDSLERELAALTTTAHENDTLRTENERLTRQVEATRAELAEAGMASASAVARAQLRIDSLERQVATLATVTRQNDELRAENERLKSDVAEARNERAEASRAAAASATARLERAQRQIKSLEQEVAMLTPVTRQHDELRAENERLKSDFAVARSGWAEASRAAAASAAVSSEKAERQIESLERQVATLATVAQENDKLRAENERLKRQAAAVRTTATRAEVPLPTHLSEQMTSWRLQPGQDDSHVAPEVGAAEPTAVDTSRRPVNPPFAAESASRLGEQAVVRESGWVRNRPRTSGTTSAARDKAVAVATTSTTPADLSASFEATRQMLERMQRESAIFALPPKRVLADSAGESDRQRGGTATVPAPAKTPVVPVGKQSMEERLAQLKARAAPLQSMKEQLAQLKARASPLQTKRKLEDAAHENHRAERVRRIFGLDRAQSAAVAASPLAALSPPVATTAARTTTATSSSENATEATTTRVVGQSRYLSNVTSRRTDP